MSGFITTLLADGPAPDRADALQAYGRFIGDWSFEAEVHPDPDTTVRAAGEIHFAWVLEGRAIQDVWILPEFFVGTTLRVFDPALDAWHIVWSDPLRQYYNRQMARPESGRIVQEGTDNAGDATRWSFLDIGADRFRWLGERRRDPDDAWQRIAEFHARRTA